MMKPWHEDFAYKEAHRAAEDARHAEHLSEMEAKARFLGTLPRLPAKLNDETCEVALHQMSYDGSYAVGSACVYLVGEGRRPIDCHETHVHLAGPQAGQETALSGSTGVVVDVSLIPGGEGSEEPSPYDERLHKLRRLAYEVILRRTYGCSYGKEPRWRAFSPEWYVILPNGEQEHGWATGPSAKEAIRRMYTLWTKPGHLVAQVKGRKCYGWDAKASMWREVQASEGVPCNV